MRGHCSTESFNRKPLSILLSHSLRGGEYTAAVLVLGKVARYGATIQSHVVIPAGIRDPSRENERECVRESEKECVRESVGESFRESVRESLRVSVRECVRECVRQVADATGGFGWRGTRERQLASVD
jgi:hypothetical protein